MHKSQHNKASNRPEYLVQRQAEYHMNQSYNKLLLALNIALLSEVNQQITSQEKSINNGTQS